MKFSILSLSRNARLGVAFLLVSGCTDYTCEDTATCLIDGEIDASVGSVVVETSPAMSAEAISTPAAQSSHSTPAAEASEVDVSLPVVAGGASTGEPATVSPPGPVPNSTEPDSGLGDADSSEARASGGDGGLLSAGDDDSSAEPRVCETDATQCADAKRLARCGADGQWMEPAACPFVCANDECTGVCEPGNVACNEQGQVTTCAETGNWDVTESCVGVCEQGECVAECTEGTYTCSGKVLNHCQGGQLTEIQTCEFLCDSNAEQCAGECNPNQTSCIEGLLATCGPDALFSEGVECANVCLGTQCGGECKPDATRCKTSQVQETCSDLGEWDETTCEFACSNGECGGVCSPGAGRCFNGGRQVCSSAGQWQNNGCPSSQVCQGTGQCLARPEVQTLTATGTALQAGRVDGKTGVRVTAGSSTTLSWTLSGGAPTAITLSPASGSALAANALSVSVTPTKTQDYVLTATNAAGSSSKTITLAVVSGGSRKFIRHWGSSSDESVAAIAIDARGKVVSVGHTSGIYSVAGVSASSQVFVAVHDPAVGTVEQIRPIGTSEMSGASMIVADAQDTLVGGSNGQSQVLLRLGPNLTINDSVTFQVDNPLGTTDVQVVFDVAVDAQRNILVGGSSWAGNSSTLVTMTGAFTSLTTTFVGAGGLLTFAAGFDRANRIVAAGNEFLRRYPNGISASPTAGTLPSGTRISDLAIDQAGNVILVGTNASGAYLAKMADNLQTVVWSKAFSGAATGVCVDDADNVVVAAGSGGELLIRSYTPTGATLWNSVTISGPNGVGAGNLACDSSGNVFVLGSSSGAATNSVGYAGGRDGVLVKIQ